MVPLHARAQNPAPLNCRLSCSSTAVLLQLAPQLPLPPQLLLPLVAFGTNSTLITATGRRRAPQDENGDGELDYGEFLASTMAHCRLEEEDNLAFAFKVGGGGGGVP